MIFEAWGFGGPFGLISGALGDHFGSLGATLGVLDDEKKRFVATALLGITPSPVFGATMTPAGPQMALNTFCGCALAPSKSPLGRFWASQNGAPIFFGVTLGGLGGRMYVFPQ